MKFLRILFVQGIVSFSCAAHSGIIPMPERMEERSGFYKTSLPLKVATRTTLAGAVTEQEKGIMIFSDSKPGAETVKLNPRVDSLGSEGYILTVSLKGITVAANSDTGLFYGLQSLKQYVESLPVMGGKVSVPCIRIIDRPRFVWRGLMLDVCRHFFDKQEVKKLLDMMAFYKMNSFQWHLTDDQGWRIEIKKYPRLTEIGSRRSGTLTGHYKTHPARYDTVNYGGFYTQQDIKEVVEYARQRFITIVPEIEIPGHAQAAIAAYPELGSTGGGVQVKRDWGISNYIYNTKESTFQFLEDVLLEVTPLFPGKYVHIGGDEAAKEQWANSELMLEEKKRLNIYDDDSLQSYFIKRIAKILDAQGKKIIGWDEILEGGAPAGAGIMNWRTWGEGKDGAYARQAINEGDPVVMTPVNYCYFDYYQADKSTEPLAIGGYLPVDSVYMFEPLPQGLTPEHRQLVLGAQANVWTEYIPDTAHLEYMIFPRLLAMAEAVWTVPDNKDLAKFKYRYSFHKKMLERRKVNYKN